MAKTKSVTKPQRNTHLWYSSRPAGVHRVHSTSSLHPRTQFAYSRGCSRRAYSVSSTHPILTLTPSTFPNNSPIRDGQRKHKLAYDATTRQAPRGRGNKGRNTGTPYGVTHRQGQSVQDIANAPSGERTLKVSSTTPPKKLAGSIVLVCEVGPPERTAT